MRILPALVSSSTCGLAACAGAAIAAANSKVINSALRRNIDSSFNVNEIGLQRNPAESMRSFWLDRCRRLDLDRLGQHNLRRRARRRDGIQVAHQYQLGLRAL